MKRHVYTSTGLYSLNLRRLFFENINAELSILFLTNAPENAGPFQKGNLKMYLEDQKMYNLEGAEQLLGWWSEEEKLC